MVQPKERNIMANKLMKPEERIRNILIAALSSAPHPAGFLRSSSTGWSLVEQKAGNASPHAIEKRTLNRRSVYLVNNIGQEMGRACAGIASGKPTIIFNPLREVYKSPVLEKALPIFEEHFKLSPYEVTRATPSLEQTRKTRPPKKTKAQVKAQERKIGEAVSQLSGNLLSAMKQDEPAKV